MISYQHKEAYCLMWYKCTSCHHTERIWNARDGVTPFCTTCPSCGQLDLEHHAFQHDQCVPDYKLNLYQRFWRDGTNEEAIAILSRRWEQMAVHHLDITRMYTSKQDYIEHCLADPHSIFYTGWPMLDICKEA
jgi:hypothetical protein